jgi:hypothetical protein
MSRLRNRQLLRRLHGQRAVPGDSARHLERFEKDVGGRHHPIDEAPARSRVRVERVAR